MDKKEVLIKAIKLLDRLEEKIALAEIVVELKKKEVHFVGGKNE